MLAEWKNLRSWEGSQHAAFEELVCQLVREEKYLPSGEELPEGSCFNRVAPPDAGKECYWELPDHSFHCWQAKFFDDLGDAQIRQLKESFSTALVRHRTMRTYVVAIPIDRTDERDEVSSAVKKGKAGRKRKSQMDRWNDFLAWCKETTSKTSRAVAIHYWGSSEVFSRLSMAGHSGRRYFWFEQPEVNPALLSRKHEVAKLVAGRRYTPATNTRVSISHQLGALRFSRDFVSQTQVCIDKIASKAIDLCKGYKKRCKEELEFIRKQAIHVGKLVHRLGFSTLTLDASQVESGIRELRLKLSDYCKILNKKEAAAARTNLTREAESLRFDLHQCYRVIDAITAFYECWDHSVQKILSGSPLLILGEAGTGKTHLFVDEARRHLEAGGGAVLLFGQKVHSDQPIASLISQELDVTQKLNLDSVMGLLNSYGEACNAPFLILIDALNESPIRDTYWNNQLPELLLSLERFPFVRVAMSVRTDFLPVTLKQEIVDRCTQITHRGFESVEYEAVIAYFSFYEIEMSTVPLDPEFANPLFLKLYCETLQRQGIRIPPHGFEGLYSIFTSLIDAVNEKISTDLKMRSDRRMVQNAIEQIARAMGLDRLLPEKEAMRIVESIHKGPDDSKSLYYSMISEGLILQIIAYNHSVKREGVHVMFAYDRFTDLIKAQNLIPRPFTSEAEAQLRDQVREMLKNGDGRFQYESLIRALSIVLPERCAGKELLDVVEMGDKGPSVLIDSFVHSILWRSNHAFSTRSEELWWNVQHGRSWVEFYDDLMTLSIRPDCPLNARTLYEHLRPLVMRERDLRWSTSVDRLWGGFASVDSGRRGSIHRIVEWALQHPNPDKIPQEVRLLWAITLTWFFTTSNRIARDHATKGLVRLLENNLTLACELFANFVEHDNDVPAIDPYITERLLCACYGAALRSKNVDGLEKLASIVYEMFFAPTPQCDHSLIRDYAIGIIELSRCRGFAFRGNLQRLIPPYDTPEFDTSLTLETVIRKHGLTPEEAERYKGAWRLIGPENFILSDFSRYEVASLIRDFEGDEGSGLQGHSLHGLIAPWMLEVILELGWNDAFERQENVVEHDRPFNRHDQEKPESLTKKYAWIALKRAEGRLCDHYKIEDGWGRFAKSRYRRGVWEEYSRDLDPSMLLLYEQTSDKESSGEHGWFARGSVMPDWRLDIVAEEWMLDSGNLPDWQRALHWETHDHSKYLLLQGYSSEEDPSSNFEREGKQYRESALSIRSYFVPRNYATRAYDWLRVQDFSSGWMPEAGKTYHPFIGEIPWHPASDTKNDLRTPILRTDDFFVDRTPPPCKILISADEYAWGSIYDTTCRTDFNFLIPCHQIIHSLRLHHHGRLPIQVPSVHQTEGFQEAAWFDAKGTCVALAPNVYLPGPRALYIRQDSLSNFLNAEGLAIVWTFRGERRCFVGGTAPDVYPPSCLSFINGAAVLRANGSIVGDLRNEFKLV